MYRSPEAKDLDLQGGHRQHQHQQHHLMISGLLRYRSAPSSVFTEACEDFDTHTMLASLTDKPPEEAHGFSLAPPHLLYHHTQQHQHQQMPSQSSAAAMEAEQQLKTPSLIRHSSSPAGLLSGYTTTGDAGAPASRRSRSSQVRHPSMMSQISESSSPEEQWYSMPSWDDDADTPMLPANFTSIKRGREVRAQNGEGLAHQFSLPEMEKLLQFQDTVPCKVRAKRGCATHPRSIAERVRRTRISERMRKLQELVPNMDKQTNTADMLDLAVEYIKELQRQVKSLSESRACCSCSSSNVYS